MGLLYHVRRFQQPVNDTVNIDFGVVLVTNRVCELNCLYTGSNSLRENHFTYGKSTGTGLAHACETRC